VSQDLFGIDIAGIIADNIGPGVLAATLTKLTPTTRTAGQLTGGTNPSSTNYSCRGFIDKKDRRNRDGEMIHGGIETILLIGKTISNGTVSPEVGDRVTIESVLYVIEALDRDPAGATFTLDCRRV